MINIQSFCSTNACDRALPWTDHISPLAMRPAILTNDESPRRNTVGSRKDRLTSVPGTFIYEILTNLRNNVVQRDLGGFVLI